MKKTIEHKIRLNIVFIYITAIVLCCAMLFFFYYSRNNIDEQRKNIETHDEVMAEIKELVHSINQAQQEVNFYIATKRTTHLDNFHHQLHDIEGQINEFKTNATDSVTTTLFQELEVLLKRKGQTVAQLRRLFRSQPITGNIREQLKTYDPTVLQDSFEIKTQIVEDTIIKSASSKKNFWRRLSSAFSSKQSTDTIITISKEIIDTIRIAPRDNMETFSKLDTIVDKVDVDYESHITSIEKQVILLLLSDQEISSSISNLLIDLYNDMLYSRLNEIKENEHWLRNNNTISIIIGMVALFLILLFVILIINDVNKGLRMRKSLEAANTRTKQLMESRHQLLLSVSHDIKTPLNSILGYLELSNTPNELTETDFLAMRNSGKYILALLENLLKFSSLQQGTLTISQTDFSVRELCEEINEMFIPLARQKSLEFSCRFDFPASLHISSDILKIKQIIINILSNAVKYTPAGSIDLQVEYKDQQLSIRISDTGIGIPEKQIDRVFQPFTRIDENKNVAEGTGFGLYVVNGLVKLLEGRIMIQSTVDQGTTVTVILPAPAASVEEKTASAQKIWMIDDDPSFSNLLTNMLERLGHQVIASNSLTDFEKNKQFLSEADMVLTDMEMSDCSGTDILHAIRAINPTLPVFVVTGRGDFDQEQAHALGFNGYLAKPVTLGMLSDLINKTSSSGNYLVSLQEMFDNDEELIREILETFRQTTTENTARLAQCISENQFFEAQAICHKMLPMFLQIGQDQLAHFLKKMDLLRGKSDDQYPTWTDDAARFIKETQNMLQTLEDF